MKVNGNLKFSPLASGELQNALIERLASDPSTTEDGRLYYNTTDHEYRYYDSNSASWKPIGAGVVVDNLITASGGIYNANGTFDGTTVDGALSSVTSSADLLDALSQMDAAIAAGSETYRILDQDGDTQVRTESSAGADEDTIVMILGDAGGNYPDGTVMTLTPDELDITALSADGGNATGGAIDLNAGDGYGSGAGGNITAHAGDTNAGNTYGAYLTLNGATTTVGGAVSLSGGYNTSGSDPSKATLNGGTNTAGGQLSLSAGSGISSGIDGGDVTLVAGDCGSVGSSDGDDGGDVTLTAGTSSGSVEGGQIQLTAGNSYNGAGGPVKLNAGSSTDANNGGAYLSLYGGNNTNAGAASLYGGFPNGSGNGGDINLQTGSADSAGDGGTLSLIAGAGGSVSGNGGDIQILPGSAQNNNDDGGDIVIRPGDGVGTGDDGVVRLDSPSNGTAELRFLEEQSNGTNYISLRATAAIGSNVTYVLPEAPAANDYVLTSQTDGTLSWVDQSSLAPTVSLDDITDVTITSASQGDVLYYDASGSPDTGWVNGAPGATSGVQAHDAGLDDIAGLTPTLDNFIVGDGSNWTLETPADARTSLGLVAGGTGDIWVEKAGDTMTGDLTMSGTSQILLDGGSAGAPELAFVADDDTGLFNSAANVLNLVTGGVSRLTINQSTDISSTLPLLGPDGSAAAPTFSFTNDTGAGLYMVDSADGTLGISSGGIERLRIYGGNVGSPTPDEEGALSVEATANYESIIGDPASAGFVYPVDDFLPNAKWVDLYYLRKSGGTMTGDLVMSGSTVTGLAALPTDATEATSKAYVDALVSSNVTWLDPIAQPDLVAIVNDEPTSADISGMYIAYGGSYPQTWTGGVSVNEYDMVHWTSDGSGGFEWQVDGNIDGVETRIGVAFNLAALDTDEGAKDEGFPTGMVKDDLAVYVGSVGADPTDISNWDFPHGRAGTVTYSLVSTTAATKTFVVSGDVTNSFKVNNLLLIAGSTGGTNDGEYTITNVTYNAPNTEVVVSETVPSNDGATGTAAPEFRDGQTALCNNEDSSHFGQSYLYSESQNKWIIISGPGAISAGTGLTLSGQTLNVNMGAGITENPTDQVGIHLYDDSAGAIILTTNGTARASNNAASQLHLLLSAGGALDQDATGLHINPASVTNDMLVNDLITFSGDAGTDQDVDLGGTLELNGDTGVSVTLGTTGSPAVSQALISVSGITFNADAGTDPVVLPSETLNIAGTTNQVVTTGDSGTDTITLSLPSEVRLPSGNTRVADADGDTYITLDAGGTDSDEISLVAGGSTVMSITSSEVDITTGGTLDLNATSAITVDGSSYTLTTSSGSIEMTPASGIMTINVVQLAVADHGAVNLYEDSGNGSNYIGLQSSSAVGSTVTYTLPEAPAGNGYVMTSTIGGVMSWVDPDTIGRSRLEDLDDVDASSSGSPKDNIGSVLVFNNVTNKYEAKEIQFNYSAGSASTSHTVTHNLGQQFVNVTVYEVDETGSPTTYNQVLPQGVSLDSENELTVTFNTAVKCIVVVTGVPGVGLS